MSREKRHENQSNIQDTDIATRIKLVREAANLTQRAFAEGLGVNFGHISKIERSLAEPSNQLIKAISAIYGIEEAWLRTGKGIFGETLISWRKWTPEQIAEAQPIRQDPVYEGVRITLEEYAEALRRMFNTLSIYKSGMKITDEVRPEVLKAKATMLSAINFLLLQTDSLMEWASPRKHSFTLAEQIRQEEAKNEDSERK